MRRQKDPSIVYDYEIGCFRAFDPPPLPPPPHATERPALARESVSRLLAQSFGRTLRSGATVPAHLRPYVRPKT